MADHDTSDKKHEATPERREEFRKQGRFARSRDAGALAATVAALGALYGTSEAALRALALCFDRTHGDLGAVTRGDGKAALSFAAAALLAAVGPAAVAAALGALLAGFAQAGIRLDLDLLEFKADRLDPISRLGQLFSFKHAAVETLLAMLRVFVIGFIAYYTLRDEIPALLALTRAPSEVALRSLGAVAVRLTLKVGAGLAALSLADYAQSRFTLEREMMMTTQELKESVRSQDGDPKVKARMRGRARAIARRRMMDGVKKADVIVTNPTHVAVALRYQDSDPAPVVVAKGHDEVALRIRAEARKHRVPIVESRALARALDAEVQIGHPIGGAHYAAVAHVLAFVFRLRGRRVAPRGMRRA